MPTSLPDTGWVLLARVVRPQGRRGEVLAEIFTDFPHAFSDRKRIFLRTPAPGTGREPDLRETNLRETNLSETSLRETRVEAQWLHKGRVVLKFEHIDSITDAEKLRGCEVVVPREERMPLEEDAVYVSDLVGMAVVDVTVEGAISAGEVVDVEPEGAGPAMLVIRTPAGEERLIPFVRAYLRRVDLAERRLEMELPPGLLAMQAPATEQEKQAAGPGDAGEEA